MTDQEPRLYGMKNSNRRQEEFWTKNCFNSSFPVALTNYMRDKGITANYITLDKSLSTHVGEIGISEVYNSNSIPNEELFFSFESTFEPYRKYTSDGLDKIDLVVKHGNRYLRALEVKLTVIPDNSTVDLEPDKWGSEIVIRPATTSICALGMIDACWKYRDDIKELFSPLRKISDWKNKAEVMQHMPEIIGALNEFEERYHELQKPLIIQPIWKTKGKTPILNDEALDVFIWSDFAFTRLFLDRCGKKKNNNQRMLRCAARMACCLYEVARAGEVDMNEVYRKIAYDVQTDKEFSSSGKTTNPYMVCERLKHPRIHRDDLHNIILNGGERYLSPERRFDQTIYFTMQI